MKLIQYQNAVGLIIIVLVLLVSSQSIASSKTMPELVTQHWSNLSMLGQTRLSRFGIHIYDASLWTEANIDKNYIHKTICALNIHYARNISADRLISSTKKEWQRLGINDSNQTKIWLDALSTIWPDVKKGDQLIMVSIPNQRSLFYNQNGLIGSIQDPQFGPAFLAIWLSEDAKFQKNRRELLNE